MKKILIVIVLLLFSLNYAYSACVVTGGACSIDSIRENNKKETSKKEVNSHKIKKDKKLIQKKDKKKEYGKK